MRFIAYGYVFPVFPCDKNGHSIHPKLGTKEYEKYNTRAWKALPEISP
jgi:hypothetical protein